jgi:hypothetical protein
MRWRSFGQGGQVSDHFVAWQASGFTDAARLEKIRTRLASFEAAFGHSSIALFDTDGRYRFSPQPDPAMAEHQRDALAAMQRRETLLIDFHQHGAAAAEPMLGMMVPMTAGAGRGSARGRRHGLPHRCGRQPVCPAQALADARFQRRDRAGPPQGGCARCAVRQSAGACRSRRCRRPATRSWRRCAHCRVSRG